jgi:hypothetical protein
MAGAFPGGVKPLSPEPTGSKMRPLVWSTLIIGIPKLKLAQIDQLRASKRKILPA